MREFNRVLLFSISSILLLSASPALSEANLSRSTALSRYDNEIDIFHPIHGRSGMVATEQHLASQVGIEILKRGGNAVDAAVAVGFALAVVLPNAGNIGGGGFLLLHDAKTGQNIALDFREVAPQKASRDMYLDDKAQVIKDQSLYSHQAIAVPGTVAGLEHALKKWGSLRLAEVMAPAIQLADQGFIISPVLARVIDEEKDNLSKWPSSKHIFFKGNQPLQAGQRLIQKDLAQSLRLIATQGARAFYHGEIGDKIIAQIQQHQGLMQKQDLENYQVIERQPIRGTYRGFEIVSMPPPSSGGVHIIQMLNILEHYPLGRWGANSAQSIHYLSESMKLAYADRSKYLGDPDFFKVPVQGLTSKKYAASLAQLISADMATPASTIAPNNPLPFEHDQTTHYSVIDQKGNAVAVTYTLNMDFGTGIVATGTGILLNNEMDDFSAKVGVPNAFGLIGNQANAIAANKRPLSSMTPTMVMKDQRPWLITGSPGGSRIISTVLQTIINSIDFEMNPAEAAATPRIHHQWQPDELWIEKGISADSIAILKQRGHQVQQKSSMGKTQTIQVIDGQYYGYSDPRNPDGATLGY